MCVLLKILLVPSETKTYYLRLICRRVGEVYPHNMCSKICIEKGCGKVFACNGHWKTAYPVCMYTGYEAGSDYLPCVCTHSPLPGQAFCEAHKNRFKGVLSQECFKDISRMFQGCVKNVSNMFPRLFSLSGLLKYS